MMRSLTRAEAKKRIRAFGRGVTLKFAPPWPLRYESSLKMWYSTRRVARRAKLLSIIFLVAGLAAYGCITASNLAGQPMPSPSEQEEQKARLQAKVRRIDELMPQWVAAGGVHERIARLGQATDANIKAGRLKEAEETLDNIIAILSGTQEKPGAVSSASPQPKAAVQQGPFITSPVPIKVGQMPQDAAIIFWSVRYDAKRPDTPSLGPSELYVMNINGENVTRLTFTGGQDFEHAAVSFDRKKIVVNRYRKGGSGPTDLFVIDVEKKTEARLVPNFASAGGGGVDWGPDGMIYFCGQPQAGKRSYVYKIRPDGTNLTQLTFADPSEPGYDSDASVSEDGSLVAYVKVVAKTSGGRPLPKAQIWVVNSNGTNERIVYDGGSEVGVDPSGPIGAMDPEISPDNKTVLFSQTNTAFKNFRTSLNTAHDIYAINLDGTGLRRVTAPGPVSIIPDWHNNKILYTEYNEKDRYIGLTLINPDGTGGKRLEANLKRMWDGGRHGKFIP